MSQLFCGKCGTAFSPEDKFCKNCGNKRKFSEQAPNKPVVNQDYVKPYIPEATPSVTTAPQPKPAASVPQPTPPQPQPSNPPKQAIPQNQKKLLTDRRIKTTINAGGTFIWAIVLLAAGILCFAGAGTIHPGLGIIGFLLCISSLMSFISSFKKTRYRSNYKIVLRKCRDKIKQEGDDSTTYYLRFDGFMDSWTDMFAEVKGSAEFERIQVGDLYYLAAVKDKNSHEYTVAAYFKESEWRLN